VYSSVVEHTPFALAYFICAKEGEQEIKAIGKEELIDGYISELADKPFGELNSVADLDGKAGAKSSRARA